MQWMMAAIAALMLAGFYFVAFSPATSQRAVVRQHD